MVGYMLSIKYHKRKHDVTGKLKVTNMSKSFRKELSLQESKLSETGKICLCWAKFRMEKSDLCATEIKGERSYCRKLIPSQQFTVPYMYMIPQQSRNQELIYEMHAFRSLLTELEVEILMQQDCSDALPSFFNA